MHLLSELEEIEGGSVVSEMSCDVAVDSPRGPIRLTDTGYGSPTDRLTLVKEA